jgi:hypothetical protein
MKGSLTMSRSTNEFLPKIGIAPELSSVKSSKDKEMTKDDDSGELVEYQHQGEFLKLTILDIEPRTTENKKSNFLAYIEPVEEDPNEDGYSDSDLGETHERIDSNKIANDPIFYQKNQK